MVLRCGGPTPQARSLWLHPRPANRGFLRLDGGTTFTLDNLIGMLRRVAYVPACAVLVTGCGGSMPLTRAPRALPAYDTLSTELFDDGIEPTAVGFPIAQVATPETDNRLRERTQVGDAVVRARVITVSEDTAHNWQLVFQSVEVIRSSKGDGTVEKDFILQVQPTDPSAGILKSMSGRLVGHTFVVFLRTFRHGSGAQAGDDADLHFHVAPDTKDEIASVRAALASGAVH
jgi:hypothetical protein